MILTSTAQTNSFKSFTISSSSITDVKGTTLSLTGNQGFAGWGTITDPVDHLERMERDGHPGTASGAFINLYGGINLAGTGAVSLGSGINNGILATDSQTTSISSGSASTLSGGSLTANYSYVGSGGTGLFTQSGGSANVSTLYSRFRHHGQRNV